MSNNRFVEATINAINTPIIACLIGYLIGCCVGISVGWGHGKSSKPPQTQAAPEKTP